MQQCVVLHVVSDGDAQTLAAVCKGLSLDLKRSSKSQKRSFKKRGKELMEEQMNHHHVSHHISIPNQTQVKLRAIGTLCIKL